jgi:hypothetical protein
MIFTESSQAVAARAPKHELHPARHEGAKFLFIDPYCARIRHPSSFKEASIDCLADVIKRR